MAMNKLTEFAKNGSKDIDKLDLETGFVVNRKPARQWFNWLFNSLTLKINEIIDANYVQQSEVVDNLTTNDMTKPVSAAQAKKLQDVKLDKTENAVSASKLQNVRTVSFSGAATGSFTYDGSANGSCVLTLANSGVQAKTYGSKAKIPVITVNAKGLITGVSEHSIQEVAQATEAVSGIARVAKADEVSAGVADNLMITPKKLAEYFNSLSFAIGQTWQDVTQQRMLGTTYTNTSNKPITIYVCVRGRDAGVTITENDFILPYFQDTYDGKQSHGVIFIISPGSTYKVQKSNLFTNTLVQWAEKA